MPKFKYIGVLLFFTSTLDAQITGTEDRLKVNQLEDYTGTWNIYGWACGDRSTVAKVEIEHQQSTMSVIFSESSCDNDASIVGKLYMTDWLD